MLLSAIRIELELDSRQRQTESPNTTTDLKRIATMSGKDNGSGGGFPEDVLNQMQAGHDKFMRDVDQDSARLQQQLPNTSSSSSTKPPPPVTAASETNIFLTFKNFVDTNLSTIAARFTNHAEWRANMHKEREAREQEELRVWPRWTGRQDSPDRAAMLAVSASQEEKREAISATMMLLREAMERNEHVPKEKIAALYKEDEFYNVGLDLYCNARIGHAPMILSDHPQWLSIAWFKRSPYSPIALEDHAPPSHREHWRQAFEDLINASLGKPMNSHSQIGRRPNYGDVHSTHFGPGLNWMLSLQCRGILPPQLPQLHNSGRREPMENLHQHLLVKGAFLQDEQHHPLDHTLLSCFKEDITQLVDEVLTSPAPESVRQVETEQDLYEAPLYEAPLEGNKALREYQQQLARLEQQTKSKLLIHAAEQEFGQEQYLVDAERDRDYAELDKLPRTTTSSREEERAKSEAWFSNQERLSILEGLGALVEENEEALREWLAIARSSEQDGILEEELRGQWGELRERLEQEREALGLDYEDDGEDDTSPVCPYRPALVPGAPPSGVAVDAERKLVAESKVVDVLSSLTTTHTTRLPDGTVTTKVVLRQRFADGREEEEEKVHSYRDVSRFQEAQSEVEGKTGKKSGGWFWT
ncbi:hypothetical protein LTR08_007342 [Meristemomyces frigidus]|nr:hypothetical protein LTR08_007342 [Meristemomyces frigidus]